MSRSDPTAAKSEALAESPACVLIVDDEGPLRRAAVQILVRKGYNVMEASDGEEAVRFSWRISAGGQRLFPRSRER